MSDTAQRLRRAIALVENTDIHSEDDAEVRAFAERFNGIVLDEVLPSGEDALIDTIHGLAWLSRYILLQAAERSGKPEDEDAILREVTAKVDRVAAEEAKAIGREADGDADGDWSEVDPSLTYAEESGDLADSEITALPHWHLYVRHAHAQQPNHKPGAERPHRHFLWRHTP